MWSESGQTAVAIALSAVMFVAFIGLAVDVGYLWIIKTELQNAMDAAALAAASRLDGTRGDGTASITDDKHGIHGAVNKALSTTNSFKLNTQPITLQREVIGTFPGDVTFAASLTGSFITESQATASAPIASVIRFAKVSKTVQADVFFMHVFELVAGPITPINVTAQAIAGVGGIVNRIPPNTSPVVPIAL